MFPMDEVARRTLAVTIQFDKATSKGTVRASKKFPNMNAAKRFYCSAVKDGLNPKVKHTEIP